MLVCFRLGQLGGGGHGYRLKRFVCVLIDPVQRKQFTRRKIVFLVVVFSYSFFFFFTFSGFSTDIAGMTEISLIGFRFLFI